MFASKTLSRFLFVVIVFLFLGFSPTPDRGLYELVWNKTTVSAAKVFKSVEEYLESTDLALMKKMQETFPERYVMSKYGGRSRTSIITTLRNNQDIEVEFVHYYGGCPAPRLSDVVKDYGSQLTKYLNAEFQVDFQIREK